MRPAAAPPAARLSAPVFVSALPVGAGFASYTMWMVVLDPRQRTPRLYRQLRQYHRLMGYAAALVAFSIGLLTCVGIFGFDVSTTRRAVHTTMGSALLIVIAAKITVV